MTHNRDDDTERPADRPAGAGDPVGSIKTENERTEILDEWESAGLECFTKKVSLFPDEYTDEMDDLMPGITDQSEHYCGYVRVPEPDIDRIDGGEIEIYGGITYYRSGDEPGIKPDEEGWIGFDTNHGYYWPLQGGTPDTGPEWTKRQTEKLAFEIQRQLHGIALPEGFTLTDGEELHAYRERVHELEQQSREPTIAVTDLTDAAQRVIDSIPATDESLTAEEYARYRGVAEGITQLARELDQRGVLSTVTESGVAADDRTGGDGDE